VLVFIKKKGLFCNAGKGAKVYWKRDNKLHRVIFILLLAMGSFLFCFSDAFAGAGEETVDEIMKGISSSFALPL